MNNKQKYLKNTYYYVAAAILVCTRLGLGAFYSSASDITPQSISAGVNSERTSRNMTSLNYNQKLAAAAAYKAQDMITRNYFAHVDPDGHYIWNKIAEEGYKPYTILGENLAINFSDTAGLMSAWMDSPEHRANILNSAFQDQGAGVSPGTGSSGSYSIAIANTFGTLAQQTPAPAPAAEPTPAPVKTTPPTKQSPAPAPTQPTPAKPAPTPVPTPNPTPQPEEQEPTISINGIDVAAGSDTAVLKGQTQANESVTISDTAQPDTGHVGVTSSSDGSFTYKFTTLQDGTHTFIAVLADGSATSAPYTITVSAAGTVVVVAAPRFNPGGPALVATALPDSTTLDVSIPVTGNVSSVTAGIPGQSISLLRGASQPDGSTVYSGTFTLDSHPNLGSDTLTLTASSTNGQQITAGFPLSSVPIQAATAAVKISNMDLYGTFKGIAIGFGVLFSLFLIGDLVSSIRKRKITAEDIIRASHLMVLLIAIGTMLAVSWWH